MVIVGDLKTIPFPDLLETYCVAGLTVRILFTFRQGKGVVVVRNGQLMHAKTGEHEGNMAIYNILRHRDGRYEIDLDDGAYEQNITTDWRQLLEEGKEWLQRDRRRRSGLPAAKALSNEQLTQPISTSAETDPANDGSWESSNDVKVTTDDTRSLTDSVTSSVVKTGSGSYLDKEEKKSAPTAPLVEVNPTASEASSGTSAATTSGLEDLLRSSGVIRRGIALDSDNVLLAEIEETSVAGTDKSPMMKAVFITRGLESIVDSYFELGKCEGALLEVEAQSLLIVRQSGLSCVFFPQPRVPVTQAMNEVQRRLEQAAGEVR